MDGTYGIIGLGVDSALWSSFISPSDMTASYSISLERKSNPLGLSRGKQGASQTSISLGYVNDTAYLTKDSLNPTATNQDYSYDLDYF